VKVASCTSGVTNDSLILLRRIMESEGKELDESRRWDLSREMYGGRVRTSRFDGYATAPRPPLRNCRLRSVRRHLSVGIFTTELCGTAVPDFYSSKRRRETMFPPSRGPEKISYANCFTLDLYDNAGWRR